jgi:hypothetical protein
MVARHKDVGSTRMVGSYRRWMAKAFHMMGLIIIIW